MTAVEFHTGVDDAVGLAARLLRRAVRQQVRVLVTAPADVLQALDLALWAAEPREFLPHVRMPGTPAAVAARTPVWLSGTALLDGAPRVCINLGADPRPALEALDRLIEIVSTDADAVQAGRERWRAYRSLGLDVVHHGA